MSQLIYHSGLQDTSQNCCISQKIAKQSCIKIKVSKEQSFHMLFSCRLLFCTIFCLPVFKKAIF